MQLFVRRSNGSTITLVQEKSSSVQDLKRHLEDLERIPYNLQRLSYNGLRLEDSSILDDLLQVENANLELNVDLLGGGKKRKKKIYTTPKKIKHKGKKVKLATIKFYKVDSNGKITRLRRECPNKDCGAGVFMASHFDRQYCGKCGLTYMHAT